jgi:hypothetical protein
MGYEEEYNQSPDENEQNNTEPKDDKTLESSIYEKDDSEGLPNDEPIVDTNDNQNEGTDDDVENLPKRGHRFRKQLLKRIPLADYPSNFEPKELDMGSWLEKIINLKASDYLGTLQKLFSKKNL